MKVRKVNKHFVNRIMDDMSLIYNINLCRLCQIPDNLDLVNTSTIADNGDTYLDLLKFIFRDILWVEDQLLTLACKLCLEKIKDVASFKKLCLESNSRRAALDADKIKFEIETVKYERDHPHSSSDENNQAQETDLLSPRPNSQLSSRTWKFNKENRRRKWKVKNTAKSAGTVEKKMRPKTTIFYNEDQEENKDNIENDAPPNNVSTDTNDKVEVTEEINLIETETKVSQYIPKYIPLPHERSCRDCKKKYANIDNLKEHIAKTHLKLRRYHCQICQQGFKAKDAMERHAYRHDGLRNYVCTICGSKYITHSDLYLHLLRHEDEPKFACELCPEKKYKTQSSLRSHIVLVHKDPKGFLCTECGTTFSQTGALKLHMLRRHGNNRNLACALCDKTFCTTTDLKVHQARHANIKAYKCDMCAADYKDRRSLSKHKAKAHGVGQYKCKDPQRYECSYCSKIIASKDRLRRHVRTHTGVKPFKCRLCDQKFNCKSYIRGHLKGKHDIDVDATDYNTKAYYDVCEELIEGEEEAGIPVNLPVKSAIKNMK